MAPRQANSFSKGRGVGCWGLAVERYLRAGQGHNQRDPRNTDNSPHSKLSGGPWVNVVVLMQMAMITVSSYAGSTVTETGGPGHAGHGSWEFLLRKRPTLGFCPWEGSETGLRSGGFL